MQLYNTAAAVSLFLSKLILRTFMSRATISCINVSGTPEFLTVAKHSPRFVYVKLFIIYTALSIFAPARTLRALRLVPQQLAKFLRVYFRNLFNATFNFPDENSARAPSLAKESIKLR